MSDGTLRLNAHHIFFKVDADKEWKKVTAESFVSSTTDDLVDEDPYMFLEPEKLSIRNLMKEWLNEGKNKDHKRCCDMCETGLKALKKCVAPVKGRSQKPK